MSSVEEGEDSGIWNSGRRTKENGNLLEKLQRKRRSFFQGTRESKVEG